MTCDLSKELKVIVIDAGNILLSYFKKDVEIFKKQQQYVTQADIRSENHIKEKLSILFPDASILAEESGKSANYSDYCWVIDPLDGTTNFIYGIPYFCISIALTYKDEPIIAVIYDPIHNDFFYAQRNNGAFLNEKRIFISERSSLKECFIVTSFPGGWQKEHLKYWQKIKNIRNKCYSMRMMGASALDLAYVSCGRYDATFFFKLKWWDVAAGMLLIEESGGKVSDFNKNKISPDFATFAAGPSSIMDDIITHLL